MFIFRQQLPHWCDERYFIKVVEDLQYWYPVEPFLDDNRKKSMIFNMVNFCSPNRSRYVYVRTYCTVGLGQNFLPLSFLAREKLWRDNKLRHFKITHHIMMKQTKASLHYQCFSQTIQLIIYEYSKSILYLSP